MQALATGRVRSALSGDYEISDSQTERWVKIEQQQQHDTLSLAHFHLRGCPSKPCSNLFATLEIRQVGFRGGNEDGGESRAVGLPFT